MTVACHYVVGCQGPVAADAEEDDMVAMATSGSSAVRLTAFLKRASQVRGQRRRRGREIRETGRDRERDCIAPYVCEQVMAALLEENAVPSGQSPLRSSQSPFPFCSSHSLIRLPTQLEGGVRDYVTLSNDELWYNSYIIYSNSHSVSLYVCQLRVM